MGSKAISLLMTNYTTNLISVHTEMTIFRNLCACLCVARRQVRLRVDRGTLQCTPIYSMYSCG